MSLFPSSYKHPQTRCGALFVGDRVEAIDDIHVEDLTLQEAMLRLKHNGLNSVRLQIVPNAIADTEKQIRSGTGKHTAENLIHNVRELSHCSRGFSLLNVFQAIELLGALYCMINSHSENKII